MGEDRDRDFLVADARTRDGRRVDVAVRDGVVEGVAETGELTGAFPADRRYDADGRLVTPSLTEPHLHLGAALTAGDPRWNESGTLAEGIRIWADYKADLTAEDVYERAERCCTWLAANGVTRVRTHADTTEPSLASVEALCALRENVDWIDIQVVAFPQDGLFADSEHLDLFEEAVSMGVDVVGGIPHNEQTREDGVASVETGVDLAERAELPLDLHVDETDDPQSRFTEVLASEAGKRNLDRVTASHATAMHSYGNAYAAKVTALLADAGVNVITNPPVNAVLQGAYDDYPRRRGHTRVDELRAAGVTVGLGQDCVMDPWYHWGRGDPLDAAYVLLHYAHMHGRADVTDIWEMLLGANSAIWGEAPARIREGAEGSLVVFDSPDPFNALRTRAPRTLVLNRGRVLARTDPAATTVYAGEERSVGFRR
jgi:cytosine deaminase